MKAAVVLLATVALATAASRGQTPQYRTATTRVGVEVSVLSGNNRVPDLAAADFALTDNGVPQQIEAVMLAEVPVDISLVVDVSGSTFSQIVWYRRDVAAVAAMLRPIDRLRLITFESQIHEIQPLAPAGGTVDVDRILPGRISSVFDGLAAALLRQSDAGRRHLVVGYTDGFDNRSVMTTDQIVDLGRTSEAVLHIVAPKQVPDVEEADRPCRDLVVTAGNTPLRLSNRPCPKPPFLQQAAEATGGKVHIGNSIAGTFKDIFRDFLNSYVLYFQPTGVSPTGWHDISVKVTRNGRYTVHARRGYFAGAR